MLLRGVRGTAALNIAASMPPAEGQGPSDAAVSLCPELQGRLAAPFPENRNLPGGVMSYRATAER